MRAIEAEQYSADPRLVGKQWEMVKQERPRAAAFAGAKSEADRATLTRISSFSRHLSELRPSAL